MIEIDINPTIFSVRFITTWVVSWHGFFSFVAVATAVVLVARWAPLKGIDPDDIYTLAIWVVLGGIIGARVVHVADNWSEIYRHDPIRVLNIGVGVAIWGGVLGGLVGGVAAALVLKKPVGVIADLTAPALVFAQVIGRLGDIVNGEHCSKATDLFFGFRWISGHTMARFCPDGYTTDVHPAIAYEMFFNIAILVIIWNLRGRLRPDGMLFALYLALYSVGRLVVQFARIEQTEYVLGLWQAQIIGLIVLAITVPLLLAKARFMARPAPLVLETAPRGTRAQRRRRSRR